MCDPGPPIFFNPITGEKETNPTIEINTNEKESFYTVADEFSDFGKEQIEFLNKRNKKHKDGYRIITKNKPFTIKFFK